MRLSILAGSALTALVLAAPLHAQLVSANVVVRTGPVRGHIVLNDGYSTYRRRPVVVYERPAPARVIVVERFRNRNDFRLWKRHGYRQIKVYFANGRYYDRDMRGAREIIVYERDGRYYRDDCDHDGHHDNYRDRDRDHDRDHWDH